jgi:predicted unusual protein kinase regulating ubiquinone biosynthesis (AarF/ABC1/UbiB family)
MTDKTDDTRSVRVPYRRVSRLGHMGAMALGVAGSMAVNGVAQIGKGQRPSLRDLMLTPTNITRVTDQLAKLRGAAMKVGQLVSMDTGDFMPPELAQIMARLRDDADSMPPAQLKKVLNTGWPDHWIRSFKSFDVRPIAAASIGQVHRAQLKDGRDLAIKVQYPGIVDSIDSDVKNVGALVKMSGLLPKGFALAPYLKEASQQLHEETDYVAEAAHMKRFLALVKDMPQFVVPRVHDDWSTPNILAMDYVAGIPIEDVATFSQSERDQLATHLINLTLAELFAFGVMQTDPNFANYRYQPDTQKIVLLDFGATKNISAQVVDQYHQLICAGLAADDLALITTAQDIGFLSEATSAAHQAIILRCLRLVFDTLSANEPISFSDQTVAKQLQSDGFILIEDGFSPPPLPIEVVLLQRKFAGIFLICARLSATVDVAALVQPYISNHQ